MKATSATATKVEQDMSRGTCECGKPSENPHVHSALQQKYRWGTYFRETGPFLLGVAIQRNSLIVSISGEIYLCLEEHTNCDSKNVSLPTSIGDA